MPRVLGHCARYRRTPFNRGLRVYRRREVNKEIMAVWHGTCHDKAINRIFMRAEVFFQIADHQMVSMPPVHVFDSPSIDQLSMKKKMFLLYCWCWQISFVFLWKSELPNFLENSEALATPISTWQWSGGWMMEAPFRWDTCSPDHSPPAPQHWGYYWRPLTARLVVFFHCLIELQGGWNISFTHLRLNWRIARCIERALCCKQETQRANFFVDMKHTPGRANQLYGGQVTPLKTTLRNNHIKNHGPN